MLIFRVCKAGLVYLVYLVTPGWMAVLDHQDRKGNLAPQDLLECLALLALLA